jgi:outer membrane immunogenic protein
MRRLGLALLASTAFVGAAAAADIQAARPVYKAPVLAPVPVYNWTGFYVGVNAGYSWGQQDNFIGGAPIGTNNVNGFIGGGQIGYNWQVNQIVFGLEADFQGSGQKGDGSFTGAPGIIPASTFTYTDKLDWFGTVRGRVGYAFDRWLPYVTGGWAYGHGSLSGAATGGVTGAGSVSNTYSGWTVGGGLEYAFLNNWSAKIEYLYVDFGNGPSVTLAPSAAVLSSGKLTDNIVRVGLNYKF